MIKFIKTVTPSPEQWQIAMEGAGSPLVKTNIGNIVEKPCISGYDGFCQNREREFVLGEEELMDAYHVLSSGYGSRLPVLVCIIASLSWWLDFEDWWRTSTHNQPLPFSPFYIGGREYFNSDDMILNETTDEKIIAFTYQSLFDIYQNVYLDHSHLWSDNMANDWAAFKAWIHSLPYSELITGDLNHEYKPTNISKDILRDIENSYKLDITRGSDVSAD